MKTKVCTQCKAEKPASEFSLDKNTRDGLRPSCKLCKRKYYYDNWEAHRSYMRQYRINKARAARRAENATN